MPAFGANKLARNLMYCAFLSLGLFVVLRLGAGFISIITSQTKAGIMASHTILNDVKFGQSDYRVYCGSESEGWDLIDMQERRVQKLGISLNGFFNDTYKDSINSCLYASSLKEKGTYYPVFVTLTYRDQDDWDAKDISNIIDRYRKDWIRRLGRPASHFRYVWVAEMQKRGVIHYHLVLWCPRGKSLLVPDLKAGRHVVEGKSDRYGAGWSKGMSNIVGVRKGVVGYLAKYLSKGSQPAEFEGKKVYFPKGARIFGMGGLCAAARGKIAYAKLPQYVRRVFDHGERIKKVSGGYVQGNVSLVSPWTFEVVKYSPIPDPNNAVGWTGGNLTCIMIYYECTFVMIEDKEEYLKGLHD